MSKGNYPVFKKALAVKLIKAGATLVAVEKNKNNDRFSVFYFQNDDEFKALLNAATSK